jgi:hypothetical protein
MGRAFKTTMPWKGRKAGERALRCRLAAQQVAQTKARFAFVCGSSSLHADRISDADKMVEILTLRTAEEG